MIISTTMSEGALRWMNLILEAYMWMYVLSLWHYSPSFHLKHKEAYLPQLLYGIWFFTGFGGCDGLERRFMQHCALLTLHIFAMEGDNLF